MTRSDDEPEPAPIPGSKPPLSSGAQSSSGAPSSTPAPAPATPAEDVPAPQRRTKLPKDLIEGYEIEQWLGEGTMGAVFRGRQISLDRSVAIKVLTPRLARNETFLRRFLREARAVARLNHPNVVSGIDVGSVRGCHYFVMEFVEGPTLLQILEQRGELTEEQATKLIRQVARALEHADKNSLVHRDVKPANIIVTKKGVAKLCDLGLAKLMDEDASETNEGRAMGTPFYISPEQARGDHDVDIRSDVYSLGATYYHAVCGRPPFQGRTPAVVMAKHLTEPLVPVQLIRPDVSRGCAAVIDRMLAKDRAERYQHPTELLEDLQLVLTGQWGTKPPAGRGKKSDGDGDKPLIRPRRRRARRRFR